MNRRSFVQSCFSMFGFLSVWIGISNPKPRVANSDHNWDRIDMLRALDGKPDGEIAQTLSRNDANKIHCGFLYRGKLYGMAYHLTGNATADRFSKELTIERLQAYHKKLASAAV